MQPILEIRGVGQDGLLGWRAALVLFGLERVRVQSIESAAAGLPEQLAGVFEVWHFFAVVGTFLVDLDVAHMRAGREPCTGCTNDCV